MTNHLVGMTEVAEILHVTPQRAHQIAQAYKDFPKPEVELASGRVWKRAAVEQWMHAHPVRKPGRRSSKD